MLLQVNLAQADLVEECNLDRFQVQFVGLSEGVSYDNSLFKSSSRVVKDLKLNVTVVRHPTHTPIPLNQRLRLGGSREGPRFIFVPNPGCSTYLYPLGFIAPPSTPSTSLRHQICLHTRTIPTTLSVHPLSKELITTADIYRIQFLNYEGVHRHVSSKPCGCRWWCRPRHP